MRPTSYRPKGLAILGVFLFSTPAFAGPLTITVVDEGTNEPVENAAVTLPGSGDPETDAFTIAQENRAFQPQVLVIPVGSDVNFPNRDDTQHHVYSFSEAKTFNIELYAGEPESPVQFDQMGIVEIGCNIHDHMQAFIIVTDRPHYALTDASGEVHFEMAPDADSQPLEANVWHRRLGDTGRFTQHTLTPEAESETLIQVTLEPKAQEDDELDQLQQEFQDL